jgi:hypothetical protein
LILPHAAKQKKPAEGEDNPKERKGNANGNMQLRSEHLCRDEAGVQGDKKRKPPPYELSIISVPPGGHLIQSCQ